MKISFFLTFAMLLNTMAITVNGQDVFDIKMKNVTVRDVLKTVESKTTYRFFFSDDFADIYKKVSVDIETGNVADLLSKLFENTTITYKMLENNMVVITPAELSKQGITITGMVADTNGEPMPGVNVLVKGTLIGAVTDVNGRYTITIPNRDATLVFSFIGYAGQEINVGAQNQVNVTLAEDTREIEEVVVVGYGTQRKVNLSGAVQAISGKELENRPITNVNLGLQGLVANMNVAQSDGRASSAPEINIRGFTSINGGSAFILVDNVPVSSEELARINPSDIESVSVLKDAASAAIYGARAAFGVVLITTKKAKSEKLSISFDANYAVRTLGKVPAIVTDPYTVMDITHQSATPLYNLYPDPVREYARQRSADPSLPDVIINPSDPTTWSYYGSTNWLKEAYRNSAPSYTANLNISKKDEKLSYMISGGYYRQDGMLRYGNDIMKRYNFRGNGTYKLTNWWQLGTNISFVSSDYESPSFTDPNGNFFWNVNRTRTLNVPRNPDGTWTADGASILGAIQEGGRKSDGLNQTQLSFNTQVDILKDVWTINVDANYRWTNNTVGMYNLPVLYRRGPGLPMQTFMSNMGANSFADDQSISSRYNVYNVYTDFHKTFAQKHYLQVLVGYNQEYQYYNKFGIRRQLLISNVLPTIQLATGETTGAQNINELALQGIFGRINYIFDQKYILEFNGRYDGTSRYPDHDRWGFFPSGSVAWVLSNEQFFAGAKDLLKIDMLKFRGSYGELGNQVNVDSNGNPIYYPYIPTMESGKLDHILDGTQPTYVTQPEVVAADLTWERVRTINGGIDLGLLNNRVSVAFDVYTRFTEGMLTKSKTLPKVFGATEPQTNAADLKTNGWELTLGWRDQFNVGNSPLFLSANFIICDSRSYITRYDNPNKLLTPYNKKPTDVTNYYKGQEIGEMWGFVTEGFYQTQEELDNHVDQTKLGTDDQQYKIYVGDIKLTNLNGDDEISYGANTVDDPGDRKIIGNYRSRVPYSFEINGSWKGFDLRLFFQGIGKRDWYPNASDIYFWGIYAQPWTNVTVQNMDHWTPETPNAYFPRVKAYSAEDQGEELGAIQTRYMQNASYLRFKNLTVGYTLPQFLLDKMNLSNLRVYFSAENLFTISHMKVDMDPEGLSGRGAYPFQQTYSFGVNLSF